MSGVCFLKFTYWINCCYLSLLGKTWSEICVGGQPIKQKLKIIGKFIKSIFWTGLQAGSSVKFKFRFGRALKIKFIKQNLLFDELVKVFLSDIVVRPYLNKKFYS